MKLIVQMAWSSKILFSYCPEVKKYRSSGSTLRAIGPSFITGHNIKINNKTMDRATLVIPSCYFIKEDTK